MSLFCCMPCKVLRPVALLHAAVLTYPVVSSGIEQSFVAICAALGRCCPASVLVIVYPMTGLACRGLC